MEAMLFAMNDIKEKSNKISKIIKAIDNGFEKAQSAASSIELSSQAHSLKELVQQFRLNEIYLAE